VSITVNYLQLVLVIIALFQLLTLATLIDDIAGAFNKAFVPFIGMAIAAAWMLQVRRLKNSIENSHVNDPAFRTPAFVPVTWWIGVGGLSVLTLVWLWELDIPALFSAFSSIFVLNTTLNTLLAIAFIVLLWATITMWQPRIANYFNVKSQQLEAQSGWLFLSPNLIGFLIFFAGPLAFSLLISFYEWDGITEAQFVGLGNYIQTLGLSFSSDESSVAAGYQSVLSLPFGVLAASDPLFWRSISNILFFMVIAVPLATIPALLLATLINVGYPGTKTFRTIFFVPAVAGVIGVTLIWKQMLNSTVGFVNWAIATFNGFVNSILPGDPLPDPVEIGWLSNPSVAMFAVMIIFAWSQFGFNTVLFTAGMQGIPKELHEAAQLDGAGSVKRFFTITLPALRATTFFVVASTIILALQLFDIIYALNQPNPVGFPDNATLSPVVYLYQLGFQQDAFGQASAVAWVLFIIIFTLTLLQFRRQRKYADES
jgi:ABC-type sugar transport system permease subunit